MCRSDTGQADIAISAEVLACQRMEGGDQTHISGDRVDGVGDIHPSGSCAARRGSKGGVTEVESDEHAEEIDLRLGEAEGSAEYMSEDWRERT